MFKLTSEDKSYLLSIGYLDKDFPQIETAANLSKFYDADYKQISADKAALILGRNRFLAGIGRSAFHWTAAQVASDSGSVVHFDSSVLFTRWP